MEEEIWKDYPGYEGLYQVSTSGRVRSLNYDKKKGHVKLLRLCRGNHGYLYVMLSKNNTQKRFSVHRMVAITFLRRVPGKDFIDHINGNPADNRVENLRWCTPSENINNPITKERLREAMSIPVVRFSLDGIMLDTWRSAREASFKLSLPSHGSGINSCCKGKQSTAYGYKWKYKKDV